MQYAYLCAEKLKGVLAGLLDHFTPLIVPTETPCVIEVQRMSSKPAALLES